MRNSGNALNIERRREAVASLACRELTEREVVAALATMGVVRPDGKPYSRALIQTDLKAITQRWQESAAISIGVLRGKQLQKIAAVERNAHAIAGSSQSSTNEKLSANELILKAHDRITKLLGADAPEKHEVSAIVTPLPDLSRLSLEEKTTLARLARKAQGIECDSAGD